MENERKIVLKRDIIQALNESGIKPGDTVIVHTSLKNLGFVCGGPQVLIEALMESVGDEGNIIMPTQSWKNLDPEAGVHWQEPEEWWDLIRQNWPAYDPAITPTNTMGATAEMFRKWPGVLRSDHPARSFAAWGKDAEFLIKNHDLSNIFGEDSPLSRIYDMNGKVLLIGVDHEKNTSLHLADVRADYPGKHLVTEHSAVKKDGKREWVSYETLAVDGEDFVEIGKDFEKEFGIKPVNLGNGKIRSMNQKDLVDFAVQWIEKNRDKKKSGETQ